MLVRRKHLQITAAATAGEENRGYNRRKMRVTDGTTCQHPDTDEPSGGGHSDVSTRILLSLIQELEADMNNDEEKWSDEVGGMMAEGEGRKGGENVEGLVTRAVYMYTWAMGWGLSQRHPEAQTPSLLHRRPLQPGLECVAQQQEVPQDVIVSNQNNNNNNTFLLRLPR
ncbi:hypothetical protein Pmani_002098 [Petrolisthes manimaculis]|uniref:Uncharacterized protein n=1 Tax=Petrolisthes manimaculis TaxID=1843537 RepID=A0AAE1QJ32_9EUCA|nr:hypothetical protein Pmani_002098 [Petrolisthes manimaculis]